MRLYDKYRGRVHFVIVDLGRPLPPALRALVSQYYGGYIPHVLVLDKNGRPVYNRAGEVEESTLSAVLDGALK